MDASWVDKGSLQQQPADSTVDVRAAARAWAAANGEKLKQVSREFCSKSDADVPQMVCYAGCQKHDKCLARWRFRIKEGERGSVAFRGHSAEEEHSATAAVCRSDASFPVQKAALERARELAVDADGSRKRPLEVQAELQESIPGPALQRALAKSQKKLEPFLTVQELEDYCQVKLADLDQEELSLSPDGGIKVLWRSIRPDDFSLVFTHVAVLYRIAQAIKASYDDKVPGFVLQTDWSGGVVWSHYHFGVVGLPLYHRNCDRQSGENARRWRRLCAPIAFVIGAWEDPPNISLVFAWSERILRHVMAHQGQEVPSPLIAQILSDWGASGAHTSPSSTQPSAFCPHGAILGICWNYLLDEAAPTFAKYMKDHVMRRHGEVWIPRFWSGASSQARAGNSCSQQGAELMIKTIKETGRKKNATKSEKEFLTAVEKRYVVASTTETQCHGFLGNSQELRLPGLKVKEFSPDLLLGKGRPWKCLNDQRWYPSGVQIHSAHCLHKSAYQNVSGNLYIMRTFWCAKSAYRVSVSEAVDMAALLHPKTFAEARERLRHSAVLVNEKLDHAKLAHFLQDLCAVDSQKLTCSCQLFRETSECGHVAAIGDQSGHGLQFLPKKVLQTPPALSKKKRGRASGCGWEKPAEDSEDTWRATGAGHRLRKMILRDYHEGLEFLTELCLQEGTQSIRLHTYGALVGAAEPKTDPSRRRIPHYEEVEGQQLFEYLEKESKRLKKKHLPTKLWLKDAPLRPGARTLADVNAQMTGSSFLKRRVAEVTGVTRAATPKRVACVRSVVMAQANLEELRPIPTVLAMTGEDLRLVPYEVGERDETDRFDKVELQPTAEDWAEVAAFKADAPTALEMTAMAVVNATFFCQSPLRAEALQGLGGLDICFGECPVNSTRLQLFWAEVGQKAGLYVLSSSHAGREVRIRPPCEQAIPLGGLRLRLAVEALRLLMGRLSTQPGCKSLVEVHWCQRLLWKGLLRRDFTFDMISIVFEAALKPLYGPCKIKFASGPEVVLPDMLVSGGSIAVFLSTIRDKGNVRAAFRRDDLQVAKLAIIESGSDDELAELYPLFSRYVQLHIGALTPKDRKGLTGGGRYFGKEKRGLRGHAPVSCPTLAALRLADFSCVPQAEQSCPPGCSGGPRYDV
eukprot:Skav210041  [mRNA]  locus=scaffold706:218069:226046:+ [translate_table: standard]